MSSFPELEPQEVPEQDKFNPIRGFELIQGGKSFSSFPKLREQLYRAIDDARYSESMLMAYDGDQKNVRNQLRAMSSVSRGYIGHLLTSLNAPSDLIEGRPKYEPPLEWMCDIDQWLEGLEAMDMEKTGS